MVILCYHGTMQCIDGIQRHMEKAHQTRKNGLRRLYLKSESREMNESLISDAEMERSLHHIASLVSEGSVIGIDNSIEMITFARSKFPQSSWPNLSFQYGDASDLKYVDEFDLVVSFACLHWVQDHKLVLEGIKRSLKSDGRLFIQFGGRGNASEILKVIE